MKRKENIDEWADLSTGSECMEGSTKEIYEDGSGNFFLIQPKPQYNCLQDLPIGTFLKLNCEYNNTCVWNGKTLCMMNPDNGILDCFERVSIKNYSNFVYTHNPEYNIVAYSDKYDGEYTPITPKVMKAEHLVPQVIKDGWKIRHIKHPDYKCGRDVAVTILYRSVESPYTYEWRYTICSDKDMFSRKKGVEEAFKRKSYYFCGPPNMIVTSILKCLAGGSYLKCNLKYKPTPEFLKLWEWYSSNH